MKLRRPPPSCLLCLVIPVFWGAIAAAVPPIKETPEGLAVRAQIAPLLRDLDSERFVVRQEAAARLGRLAAQPEWAETVAAEFQRVLGSSGTSLEVRKQLEALLGKDAARPQPPQEHVSPEEIDRLVAQLEDNSYGVRVGAAKRLQWLLENPKMVCPILNRLKRRMDGDRLTADARQWLEPLYNRARRALADQRSGRLRPSPGFAGRDGPLAGRAGADPGGAESARPVARRASGAPRVPRPDGPQPIRCQGGGDAQGAAGEAGAERRRCPASSGVARSDPAGDGGRMLVRSCA